MLLDRLIGYRGFKALAFVGGSADRVFAIDTDLKQAVLERAAELRRADRRSTADHRECPGALTAIPGRRTALVQSPPAEEAVVDARARGAPSANRAGARGS